ncbi:MAG: hypothetical protein RIM99_16410 [Cyclobacteriaceae bacterium]
MKALIILTIIGITACSTSRPLIPNQESEKLAEEYRVNPNEAVIELKIQEVESKDGNHLITAKVVRVTKISFGFKQVNENQVLTIVSDVKLNKDDQVFALMDYYQQQSGPEYSLRKIF